MKRIIADGSFLVSAPWTGIAQYSANLLEALSTLPVGERIDVYDGVGVRALPTWVSALRENTQAENPARESALRRSLRAVPFAASLARTLRNRRLRPLWERSAGLFHALNYVPPFDLAIPVLPVVYDLSYLVMPEAHEIERVRAFEKRLPLFQSAPAVQTISAFSKAEIMRLLSISGERIHVVRPCPDPACLSLPLAPATAEEREHLRRSFGVEPDGYVLGVGTLEPRKNLPLLVEAYLALPADLRAAFPLLLAGARGWGRIAWPAGHAEAIADGTIRQTGYVSRAHLRLLLRHARLSAYPSVYEGYGLPVVESLCFGTPVLVTRGTACEEAGFGLATALPPGDCDAWTEALRTGCAKSESPEDRQNTRAVMASGPNWRDAAQAVEALYAKISAGC